MNRDEVFAQLEIIKGVLDLFGNAYPRRHAEAMVAIGKIKEMFPPPYLSILPPPLPAPIERDYSAAVRIWRAIHPFAAEFPREDLVTWELFDFGFELEIVTTERFPSRDLMVQFPVSADTLSSLIDAVLRSASTYAQPRVEMMDRGTMYRASILRDSNQKQSVGLQQDGRKTSMPWPTFLDMAVAWEVYKRESR